MLQTTNENHSYQVTSYPRLASELSGEVGDIDLWEKGQSFHKRLLEQSHDIAAKLESQGIEAYNHEQDLVLIGLHSRQHKVVPNFRNINFIPTVGRKNRNRQSKELTYFLQSNPNCRMWTISTGVRCSSSELVGRVKKLHRQVSKINSMPFMKHAGLTFVYRATEFGEVAPDGDDLSFHPHCHALLHLDRYLPKAEWSQVLSKIRAYFGAYSQDNGRIRNPRELVKYCVKPSDLEHLTAAQVALLYHSSKGLRLCESLQSFRKLRGHIRETKLKVIQRKGIMKLVPSWNQAQTVEESIFRPIPKDDGVPSPSVLAWCVPARVFTPITEPIMLVHGLAHRDPSVVFKWPEVQQMQERIKVHTKMLTVPTKEQKSYDNKPKVYQTGPPV